MGFNQAYLCSSTMSCSSSKPNACSCDYAWLTSLTSLHHSTYASMHVHGIQTNQNPNGHKRYKTKNIKQNRETETQG